MRIKHRLLLAAGAALVATATGVTLAVAMRRGERIPEADEAATGMVRLDLVRRNGAETCTGTLLAPRWVLTARHCVEPHAYFGNGGTHTAPPGDVWGDGAPSAVIWDGHPDRERFVVAGAVHHPTDFAVISPAIWAFDRSGATSAGFGAGGGMTMTTLSGGGAAALVAVSETPTGYVAAGSADDAGGERPLVMQYDHQGRLVRSSRPVAATPAVAGGFAVAYTGRARAIVVDQGSGDIFVVGSRIEGGIRRWQATRFDIQGVKRPAYAYLDGQAPIGELIDVRLFDGKLVVLGVRTLGPQGASLPAVAVLGDTGFAVAPKAIPGWDLSHEARALAASGPGRVVIAGNSSDGDLLVLSRHDASTLELDPDFGTGGLTSRPIETTFTEVRVADADVATDGSVVLALDTDWFHAGHSFGSMMAARFTRDGEPDPAFGQNGLLVAKEEAPAKPTALALPPGGDRMVIVGVRTVGVQPVAVAFELDHDHVTPASKAHLGAAQSSITKVVRPDDAFLDIALLELESPLTTEAGVRFRGFAAADELEANEKVVCYGYGRNNDGDSGKLYRGTFLYDEPFEAGLGIWSQCTWDLCGPEIDHGDSGGGCFVLDADGNNTWRQLGVTSLMGWHPSYTPETWWPSKYRGWLAPVGDLRSWVLDVVGPGVIAHL